MLIEALCQAIAATASKNWLWAPTVLVLWPYLRRLAGRLQRLLARLDAGGAPSRPRRPSPSPEAHRAGACLKMRLPRGFGWLCILGPEVRIFGHQLAALLADPDLAAKLAASPQAGRLLRPVLRMLGQECPALPRPPPRPSKFVPRPSPPPAPEPRRSAPGPLLPGPVLLGPFGRPAAFAMP